MKYRQPIGIERRGQLALRPKGVLALAVLWWMMITTLPTAVIASPKGIVIEKITIGEDVIDPNRDQLIEVLIKNYDDTDRSVVVKLAITPPNQIVITHVEQKVVARSKTDTRALLVFPIDPKLLGEYTVEAKVFSVDDVLLVASSEKQAQQFYAGDPPKTGPAGTKPSEAQNEKGIASAEPTPSVPVSPLQFDPPDLLFEHVSFTNNNSILRGETAHVRLVLTNQGGDIAENVELAAYWYFEYRPRRRVQFFEDRIAVVAPGERKIIQVPLTIPATEQKGRYEILAVIDPHHQIQEINKDNNSTQSDLSLVFADIALEFPEALHSFAEDGRFLFEWRSELYNQFKVQISADQQFLNKERFFEMPKGETWETSRSIRPLPGEWPGIVLALMEENNLDHLYWRVRARNSQGEIAESSPRIFYITLKPDTQ
jgi:hypothetical protein